MTRRVISFTCPAEECGHEWEAEAGHHDGMTFPYDSTDSECPNCGEEGI